MSRESASVDVRGPRSAAWVLLGAPVVGAVATGAAFVAAVLDAAPGFCLGCELHLLVRRAARFPQPARTA